MFTPKVLQHLCALDKSSPEFLRSLYSFIRLDEEGEYSFNLSQSDSASLVDFLDGALDAIPVTDVLFRRCLRRLRHICGHCNVLPSSHTIREGLKKTGENPVAYGGFADVWEGTYGGEKVCVKALRIYNPDTNTNNQKSAPFYGEAVVWKRLTHPNVVRFLGVTTAPLQIVLEWMPNGTLTDYVNSHPQADRIGLLLDVAEGVNYLHTCHMFHGDLKGPNILIDDRGYARVSDFGLASIARGKYSTGVNSDKGHTVRWSAPEVLFGAVPASKQADMFAFGMVVVETFTGKVPFHNTISTAVSYKTMSGERPPRPHGVEMLGFSDALWKMTESCWQHDPTNRLRASEVVDLLREMYVTSPNNPLVDVISNTEGLVGSGSITPQTDAALSPKLLEILQCSESTRKRGLSDLIPLTGDKKIATKSLPKKSVNTVGHQIQTRCPANRKTQRTTGTDQGRNGQRPPFPLTTPHRRNLDQVPKPMDSVQNPTDVPGISVQAVGSIHSDGSSFTVVDGSVDRKPTEANREAGKFNNTRKFKPQQPRLSDQALSGPGQDHPAFPVEDSGRDPGQQCRRGSVRNRGLLDTLGRGGGSSKPSTRSTTPTGGRRENSKDEADKESEMLDIPLQRASNYKGFGRWGRVRVMARVMGLHKQVQSQSNGTEEK